LDVDKLLAGIERFFLDIIGVLIPGGVLLLGLMLLYGPREFGHKWGTIPSTTGAWWMFVAAAYVTGHAIATVGNMIVRRFVVRALAWLTSFVEADIGKRTFVTEADVFSVLAGRETTRKFVEAVDPTVAVSARNVREWRTVALTLIAADDRTTAERFMFLAMLNLGVTTALWILLAAVVLKDPPSFIPVSKWWLSSGTMVLTFFLLHRSCEFYARTMRAPFGMALAVLKDPRRESGRRLAPGAMPE
jgi:hypothetical protein